MLTPWNCGSLKSTVGSPFWSTGMSGRCSRPICREPRPPSESRNWQTNALPLIDEYSNSSRPTRRMPTGGKFSVDSTWMVTNRSLPAVAFGS